MRTCLMVVPKGNARAMERWRCGFFFLPTNAGCWPSAVTEVTASPSRHIDCHDDGRLPSPPGVHS